ncbi:MAG TPA: hypothetical protein PLI18_04715 [Pirellulaceae bacterium]|nr:hypothetical protein [Pirellulaceae bacterium]
MLDPNEIPDELKSLLEKRSGEDRRKSKADPKADAKTPRPDGVERRRRTRRNEDRQR